MGINGQSLLNTELPFESVPDEFIDVSSADWHYTPGAKTVPIILPRTYINMYNFGFARSHNLPKISDGLVGMIDMVIFIHANGRHDEYKGRVIGFSNRLNSILVPQAFIEWSNAEYAPGQQGEPNRLMMEVANPADERITQYLDQRGYEVEDDKLQAEKTTYFLKMVVADRAAILVDTVFDQYYLFGRYEYYDSYIPAADQPDYPYTNRHRIAVGFNWLPIPQIAVKAEYSHRFLKAGYNPEPSVSLGICYMAFFKR